MDELDEFQSGIHEVGDVYGKTIRFGRGIADLFFANIKGSPEKELPKPDMGISENNSLLNFSFTGKDTDLCYFNNADTLPLSAIANIQDEKLKQSVIDTFDRLSKNGYITLEGDSVKITEKGRQRLSDTSFSNRAKSDQQTAFAEKTIPKSDGQSIQMCAELSGNYINDFTVFNHTDSIDLRAIAKAPDKKLSAKIMGNIKQWQECGAVTVKNGKATVTKAGRELLSMPEFTSKASEIVEKPLTASKGTVGKILVATKKITSDALQTVKKSNAQTR